MYTLHVCDYIYIYVHIIYIYNTYIQYIYIYMHTCILVDIVGAQQLQTSPFAQVLFQLARALRHGPGSSLVLVAAGCF